VSNGERGSGPPDPHLTTSLRGQRSAGSTRKPEPMRRTCCRSDTTATLGA
jgi:hypothetical protein